MSNVGLVAVSHSKALAEAACELAKEMGKDTQILPAGGTEDGEFGTNAELIAAAIEEADSGAGVVVLVDLGSAVMSTEIALEFIDPDLAERTEVVPAALVEGLVVAAASASAGASLEQVAAEAMGALRVKAADIPYSGPGSPDMAPVEEVGNADPGAQWISRRFEVDDPAGLHARPAAAMVAALSGLDATVHVSNEAAGRGPVLANSMTALITLGVQAGQEILVQASGTDATAALEAIGALAARGWVTDGEEKPEVSTIPAHKRKPGSGMEIAVGPALVWRRGAQNDDSSPAEGYAQARERVFEYLNSLDDDPILQIQIGLLDDPAYTAKIDELLESGTPAQIAVRTATEHTALMYRKLPTPYLRERATDVEALGSLLVDALRGRPLGGLGQAIAKRDSAPVVVLESLTPALASEIAADSVIGIVAATGSPTGHGALIAASKGIPLVVGNPVALEVADGQEVALEPATGMVTIEPTREQLHELLRASKDQARLDEEARKHSHEPVEFAGKRVLVEANISAAADADLGAQAGADGSGLVRTEVLFGEWDHLPSVEEQAETFTRIAQALGAENSVLIRSWDVGADKPVTYFHQDEEDNPFLGERGVRLMRRFPGAFEQQLRAMIRAAQTANVQVLIPMVTTPDEMRWTREIFQQALAKERELWDDDGVGAAGAHGAGADTQLDHGETAPAGQTGPADREFKVPKLGMMLETPAAAFRIEEFAGLIDFISVGTNDLIQYVAAADRGNASVAAIAQNTIPAVIRLIEYCVKHVDCPVGVCGDLASSLPHVGPLLEAGVSSLSVRPALVPQIKQAVRKADTER